MNFNYLRLRNKKVKSQSFKAFEQLWLNRHFSGAQTVAASLHGCLLGNNQRKVSCWEDGLAKNILKISTARSIVFPGVVASQLLKATVDAAKWVFVQSLLLEQDRLFEQLQRAKHPRV
ncbi:MAG: hypothetical protein KME23_16040 [Goleter apudmare HA4340-LM2]|jgi:hypothetical protein|nr:hypothetical protein [Goleter apudmare HA4340-LM2]